MGPDLVIGLGHSKEGFGGLGLGWRLFPFPFISPFPFSIPWTILFQEEGWFGGYPIIIGYWRWVRFFHHFWRNSPARLGYPVIEGKGLGLMEAGVYVGSPPGPVRSGVIRGVGLPVRGSGNPGPDRFQPGGGFIWFLIFFPLGPGFSHPG